jgi:hypothetical protein
VIFGHGATVGSGDEAGRFFRFGAQEAQANVHSDPTPQSATRFCVFTSPQ